MRLKLILRNLVSPFCLKIFEIYKADGSLDVLSSKRTGALGRFQSEIWNIGGQPGEKMRCQLVTTVHHQTKVTEWKEIYFIS